MNTLTYPLLLAFHRASDDCPDVDVSAAKFTRTLQAPPESARNCARAKTELRSEFVAWFRSHPEPSSSNTFESELIALLSRAEKVRMLSESST